MTRQSNTRVSWARCKVVFLGLSLILAGVEAIAASSSKMPTGAQAGDEDFIVMADDAGRLHRVRPMKDGLAVFEKLDPNVSFLKELDLPEGHNRSGGTEFEIKPRQSASYKAPTGEWRDLKLPMSQTHVASKIEKDGAGNFYVLNRSGVAMYFKLADGKGDGWFDHALQQSIGGMPVKTAAIPDGSGMLVLSERGDLYRVPIPLVSKAAGTYSVERLASRIHHIESTGNHILIAKQDGSWGFAPLDNALHGEKEFSKRFRAVTSMDSYPLWDEKFMIRSNQNPGMRGTIERFVHSSRGAKGYEKEFTVIASHATGKLFEVRSTPNGLGEIRELDEKNLDSITSQPPPGHIRSGGTLFRISDAHGWEYKTPMGEWKHTGVPLVAGNNIEINMIEKDGAGNLIGLDENFIARYYTSPDGKHSGVLDHHQLHRSIGGEIFKTAAIPDGSGILVLGNNGQLFRVWIPPQPTGNGTFEAVKLADGVHDIYSTGGNVLIMNQSGDWGYAPPARALLGEYEFSDSFMDMHIVASRSIEGEIQVVGSNQFPNLRDEVEDFKANSGALEEAEVERYLLARLTRRICGRDGKASVRNRKRAWQRPRPRS